MSLRTRFSHLVSSASEIAQSVREIRAPKAATLGAVMMAAATMGGCASDRIEGFTRKTEVRAWPFGGIAAAEPDEAALRDGIAQRALQNPVSSKAVERAICNSPSKNEAADRIKGRNRWAVASGAQPELNCTPRH